MQYLPNIIIIFIIKKSSSCWVEMLINEDKFQDILYSRYNLWRKVLGS